MNALKTAWTSTPKHIRDALGQAFLDQLKAAGAALDTIGEADKPATVERFNSELQAEEIEVDNPF